LDAHHDGVRKRNTEIAQRAYTSDGQTKSVLTAQKRKKLEEDQQKEKIASKAKRQKVLPDPTAKVLGFTKGTVASTGKSARKGSKK